MTDPLLPESTDVLVVGGGPTGLASAAELGMWGVDAVVVEPRREVAIDRPRAKNTSVRTMELLRRWGWADAVRRAAPLDVGWSQDVVFCTTLTGREITRFSGCLGLFPERVELAAESGQQIPQPLFERAMRPLVASLPSCSLAFGWEVVALDRHGDEVQAVVRSDAGDQRSLRARYVLGCDGARSLTRESIGIALAGESASRSNLGITFRSSRLADLVPYGPAIHYWTLSPDCQSLVGRFDLEEMWWMIAFGEEGSVSDGAARSMVELAVGQPLQVEVMATDPWTARMLIADRFGEHRIFLVGDAAHLCPPFGGHGFNTGVGDAVNIGWKVAAVLHGWGGPGLLDTYEAERRPLAQQTVEEATRDMMVLSDVLGIPIANPHVADDDAAVAAVASQLHETARPAFYNLGLVLGYGYGDSPIVVGDGSTSSDYATESFVPTASPGMRLPHVWMRDGRSLYDLLGRGFSVLRLDRRSDAKRLQEHAGRRGVPLTVVDLCDQGLRSRFEADLVLVRPDQHVAWRGSGSQDVAKVLDQATGW